MCGCVLLKCFEVTQPTLAHDMKVLTEAGIVTSRGKARGPLYSLNMKTLENIRKHIDEIQRNNADKSHR